MVEEVPTEAQTLLSKFPKNERLSAMTYEANKDSFSFEEVYEVSKIAEAVLKRDAARVVLQFPLEMLVDSIKVKEQLEKLTGKQFYVLSDSVKSSCCVDTIGAKHITPNMIVHFGDACFSDNEEKDIEIRYILPKVPIDTDKIAQSFEKFCNQETKYSAIVLFWDVIYDHCGQAVVEKLRKINGCPRIIPAYFRLPGTEFSGPEYTDFIYGRCVKKEDHQYLQEAKEGSVAWMVLGNWVKLLQNLDFSKQSYGVQELYYVDPATVEIQKRSDSKELLKRIHLINKAKEANVFGILINKANIKQYEPTTKRLKEILKSYKKRCYTFLISKSILTLHFSIYWNETDKLTETKLQNFPEVDAFILISCPNESFYDFKEFYKVLITPFEAEFALRDETWGLYVVNDLSQYIKTEKILNPEKEAEKTEEKAPQEEEKKTSDTLTTKTTGELIKHQVFGTLTHFQQRTFQGLDASYTPEVTLAIKGKEGLARGYKDLE